jgi:hypothetical protein
MASFFGKGRHASVQPHEQECRGLPVPSTDEQAIEMLSSAPDSGALVENYVGLGGEGMGVEQAMWSLSGTTGGCGT